MKKKRLLNFFIKTLSSKSVRQVAQHRGAPDRWLLVAVVLLSLFGVLMVYDASVAIAIRDFADQYHFMKEQVQWLVIGLAVMGITTVIDYRVWHRFSVPLLIITIGMLLAVFIPGLGIGALGARRWLGVGPLVVQPAEVAKLTLAIYLAAWFSSKEPKRLNAFLLLIAIIVGLVVLEPDLGTATVLLAIAVLCYFYSGAPLWHFAVLAPVAIGGILLLAVISPYRFARLTTFVNPQHDPLGASYQIRQVLLGLGSGGIFGVGVGQSRQKYEYLPEANTDAIFSIIGEEVGLVGSSAVIGIFSFIIWRGFRIARRTSDTFGRLLALGITSYIGVQTIINLGAMVALLPLTGIPLPFVSYGGSSLVMTLTAVGMVLNISRSKT